mmetsp:Transcript_27674/g.75429  ORF Transcript_27674/g.75429 Transcript_27674/m.75429 type:complete len:267 (+) Transcript_27674:2532-3332(+)
MNRSKRIHLSNNLNQAISVARIAQKQSLFLPLLPGTFLVVVFGPYRKPLGESECQSGCPPLLQESHFAKCKIGLDLVSGPRRRRRLRQRTNVVVEFFRSKQEGVQHPGVDLVFGFVVAIVFVPQMGPPHPIVLFPQDRIRQNRVGLLNLPKLRGGLGICPTARRSVLARHDEIPSLDRVRVHIAVQVQLVVKIHVLDGFGTPTRRFIVRCHNRPQEVLVADRLGLDPSFLLQQAGLHPLSKRPVPPVSLGRCNQSGGRRGDSPCNL